MMKSYLKNVDIETLCLFFLCRSYCHVYTSERLKGLLFQLQTRFSQNLNFWQLAAGILKCVYQNPFKSSGNDY